MCSGVYFRGVTLKRSPLDRNSREKKNLPTVLLLISIFIVYSNVYESILRKLLPITIVYVHAYTYTLFYCIMFEYG